MSTKNKVGFCLNSVCGSSKSMVTFVQQKSYWIFMCCFLSYLKENWPEARFWKMFSGCLFIGPHNAIIISKTKSAVIAWQGGTCSGSYEFFKRWRPMPIALIHVHWYIQCTSDTLFSTLMGKNDLHLFP